MDFEKGIPGVALLKVNFNWLELDPTALAVFAWK